ncbi:unnamed protein product, partial [Discosporangium mesarthrocarpum]
MAPAHPSSSDLYGASPSGGVHGSVFARDSAQKGVVVHLTTPLLVHQTLANRRQVLACANCNRFVGTAASQLAMLQGNLCDPEHALDRARTGHDHLDSGGSRVRAAARGKSRRLKTRDLRAVIATAGMERLPNIPLLPRTRVGVEDSSGIGA